MRNLKLIIPILFYFTVSCKASIMRNKETIFTIDFDPQILKEEEKIRRNENLTEFVPIEKNLTLNRVSLRALKYGEATFKGLLDNKTNWDEKVENKNEPILNITKKKIVCYYTMPSYLDRPFAVFPEQIDPFLCTHIITFVSRRNTTVQFSDPKDKEFSDRTLKLKLKNKDLKYMACLGIGNANGAGPVEDFGTLIGSPVLRKEFINNSIKFLKENGFDGVDFDWEFPAWGSPEEQRSLFSILIKDFRNVMSRDGFPTLLTAAVGAPKPIVDVSYDVKELAMYLDFINLMAYDMHTYTSYTPFTGANAPLKRKSSEIGYFTTLNTVWAANYWQSLGMPAEKIMVGVPTYGRTYKLVDAADHEFYSLALGIGSTGDRGYIQYPEVCEFIKGNGTVVVFDEESRVPYTYKDREWITYENEKSVEEKGKWIKNSEFGGAMIFSLNNDDAWKMCNTSQVNFPLAHKVNEQLS